MKKWAKPALFWAVLIISIILFLFLRLYKIKSSFLFFNDPGRDLLALYRWQETGKPPLLGPQTSDLPFNQSALYFYLLYPLWLITNHSLFSTIYTVILFYLTFLLAGIFFLRKHPRLLKTLTAAWFLIAIHPQFILQHRYVWNPSFVAPLIIAAFFSFHLLCKKFSPLLLFIFSISIAGATAFSYSAAPVLLAFLILAMIRIPKRTPLMFLATAASLVLVNLPTIFFELRHNFTLTKLLFKSEKLTRSQNSLFEKLNNVFNFLIISLSKQSSLILLGIIIAAVLCGFYYYRRTKFDQETNKLFQGAGLLFLITLFITLIMPYPIHAHYIFGILSLGIIIIALLPYKTLVFILLLCGLFWLRPQQTAGYFKPAHRSVAESISCAEIVCQNENQPMFVSLQAGFHPYHHGPEFRYLFKSAGCEIKDIEQEPESAKLMAVVVDSSNYEHGKTRYHELELFGESKEVRVYQCQDSLKVHILSR